MEDLFKISIVCGLAGLDLKGATAAASSHSNEGIPMKNLLSESTGTAADFFCNSLLAVSRQRNFPIFHLDELVDIIESAPFCEFVWMTDNIIETYIDLMVIEYFLENYNVKIILIPKMAYMVMTLHIGM